ncbi:hypothetical protein GJ496_010721 [Pomphorhynchus laevis]|nr:hypothetical protein GJ496_010721 [Pomphorhynchus laevis]
MLLGCQYYHQITILMQEVQLLIKGECFQIGLKYIHICVCGKCIFVKADYNGSNLANFDLKVRSILSRALNLWFSDDAWQQASLQVNLGRLGMYQANDIAAAAFGFAFMLTNALVASIIRPNRAVHTGELNPDYVRAIDMWTSKLGGSIPSDLISKKTMDSPVLCGHFLKAA